MSQDSDFQLSVIVPCFNASKTITKCVDSILNQTYRVNEIVLVDDCSQDNTWSILQSIQSSHSDVAIVIMSTDKNSGPSVARNLGIKSAKSNWIAFLDSDDYWDETKIEKQVRVYHENDDVKLISCAYKKKKLPERIDYKEISFSATCFKNYFETPTVLAEKKVLEEFPFNPQQKHSEDYMVWLKIVRHHKAICLNEILAFCILDKKPYGDSGLSQNIWKMEKGELKNFKTLYQDGDLNFLNYVFFSSFSLLKFFRRFLIVSMHKLFQ